MLDGHPTLKVVCSGLSCIFYDENIKELDPMQKERMGNRRKNANEFYRFVQVFKAHKFPFGRLLLYTEPDDFSVFLLPVSGAKTKVKG